MSTTIPGTLRETSLSKGPFRAARGTQISCKGWQQEAALRMLMNNLDPEVAENPQELVVYGGTGKAARNWECFHAIVRSLKELAADETLLVHVVADGMGGQERGEQASSMAVDIIPKVVRDRLAANEPADQAVQQALAQANAAIIEAGRGQPEGRRMGTTAVLALRHQDQVYVAGLGDSRAYLIRGDRVEQLTMDHSVAAALVACGALTAEEARHSPYQHVLHKFWVTPVCRTGPRSDPSPPARATDSSWPATA